MQISRQLPRHILTALQAAGQANRFFSDMARLDVLEARGMDDEVAAESARVLAYVAHAVGCTVDQLRTLLVMTQRAPDSRTLMVPIADRLFAERERLGLSREQLAAIGGVSVDDQCSFEGGCSMAPPSHYLAQLARDAGIDVLFVLTGRREVSRV